MTDRNGAADDGRDPKAIAKWGVLGLLLAYVVAFVLSNRHEVELDFVFFTSTVSMVFALVLTGVLGLVMGFLGGAIRRRRRRRDR